ncbi:hypothetical protein GYMLUDRAFT_69279 [Collybiopsis luxurians FD-317 M1]|nr:hypothetical protein GYMLUDRAFT_69279 [Collybiopsis luxurians FD-317 M1]
MDSSIQNAENTHLTLRIPRPKHRMSTQTSNEAKTRCERCRKKNLKCDRAVPTCQNCAGLKECKYTSSNHSHRGIPRCATCQKYGLKCDRDMPACNQCQLQGKASECAYLPRRRRNGDDKITFEDDIGTKAGNILKFDKKPNDFESTGSFPSTSAPIRKFKPSIYQASSSSYHPDSESRISTRGPGGNASSSSANSRPPTAVDHAPPAVDRASPAVRHTSHLQFAPLPSAIIQSLEETQFTEMPDRETFDHSIGRFLKTLMPEMQESASLSSSAYAGVARYLVTGEIPRNASSHLQKWMTTHRLLPGSQTHPLILIPRDPIPDNLAFILQQYQADPARFTHGQGTTLPEPSIFDRLPVRNELYDILVHAHRGHADSITMADETRRMGFAHITWPMADIFVRLCPVCAKKGESESGDDNDESP